MTASTSTQQPITQWFSGDFFRVPVIAVFRGLSAAEAVRLSVRAWDAGVEHVEIPIQTIDAVPVLQAVADAAAERGLVIGAGTVTTLEQLDAATNVGVAFTVSPGLDPVIVAESVRRGIPPPAGVSRSWVFLSKSTNVSTPPRSPSICKSSTRRLRGSSTARSS